MKMEEKKQDTKTGKETKPAQAEKPSEKPGFRPSAQEKKQEQSLVRIAMTDIPGNMNLYAGLTRIKGISWTLSSIICKKLGLDKKRKMSTLSDQDIEKILTFVKNPDVPSWLLNRRKDYETGQDKHLITTDLDLTREFDVRRIKKMRSYKGIRHMLGQPVRGQRTRAHFRKGKSVGVTRAKVKPAAAKPAAAEKK